MNFLFMVLALVGLIAGVYVDVKSVAIIILLLIVLYALVAFQGYEKGAFQECFVAFTVPFAIVGVGRVILIVLAN